MNRTSLRSSSLALACLALAGLSQACAAGEPSVPMRYDAHVPPSPDGGSRDLGGSDLGATDLGSADLGANDLGGADLGSADLGSADLGSADLGSADLGSADLGSADLGPTSDAGPLAGYRHTITIDGVNDFDAAPERFDTTTAGYSLYVSWDADALYLGANGPDIASGGATKWLLFYLDTNGAGAGSSVGVTYNTQTPALPAGFSADFVFRWRADNTFQSLQRWDVTTSTWVETTVAPTTFQAGTFVETRLPLIELGAPTTIGIAALMLNEAAGVEFSYSGMPSGTFADGYHATIPMTRWLSANRSLTANPNDASRLRP